MPTHVFTWSPTRGSPPGPKGTPVLLSCSLPPSRVRASITASSLWPYRNEASHHAVLEFSYTVLGTRNPPCVHSLVFPESWLCWFLLVAAAYFVGCKLNRFSGQPAVAPLVNFSVVLVSNTWSSQPCRLACIHAAESTLSCMPAGMKQDASVARGLGRRASSSCATSCGDLHACQMRAPGNSVPPASMHLVVVDKTRMAVVGTLPSCLRVTSTKSFKKNVRISCMPQVHGNNRHVPAERVPSRTRAGIASVCAATTPCAV